MAFETDLQKYIHISKYARWMEEKNRRETWYESVDRYCDFFIEHINSLDISQEDKNDILKEIG